MTGEASGKLPATQAGYRDEGFSVAAGRTVAGISQNRQQAAFIQAVESFRINLFVGDKLFPVYRCMPLSVSQQGARGEKKRGCHRVLVYPGIAVKSVIVYLNRYRNTHIPQDGKFRLIPVAAISSDGGFGEYLWFFGLE